MTDDDGLPLNWSLAAKHEFLKAELRQKAQDEQRDWRVKKLEELSQRVAQLERVVEALPAAMGEALGRAMKNQPGLSYGGVHDEGSSYKANVMVTSAGSLWVSLVPVEKGMKPGKAPGWRLIAKAGSAPAGFA